MPSRAAMVGNLRPMHESDFDHEHLETAVERAAVVRTIWDQDNVSFKTVGIDIGSSTSHLLFAKVALQRQSQGLSSRFVVVGREIVWRSPFLLTPADSAAPVPVRWHNRCRKARRLRPPLLSRRGVRPRRDRLWRRHPYRR